MRGWLIAFIFILISIVFVLGERSKSDRDSDANNLPSTVQPLISKNDTLVIAAPDGTIYLVDNSTHNVFASFSSGPPIYASFHQLPNHKGENLDVAADSDDLYMDFGEDGKLYWHKTGHKIEKLASAEELVKHTPFASAGGLVLGSKRTAVFLFDAKTGKLVRTVRSDDLPSVMEQSSDATSMLVRKNIEEWLPASAKEIEALDKPLYITRTDYALKCNSLKTGEVLWYLMFANVEVSYDTGENFLGGVTQSKEFTPKQTIVEELSRPSVIHIRGLGSLESDLVVGGLQAALPGGRILSLPPPDHHNPILESDGNLLMLHHSTEKEKMLALPSAKLEEVGWKNLPNHEDPLMIGHVRTDTVVHPRLLSTILYSTLVPLTMALFLYIGRVTLFGRHSKLDKSEDLKSQIPKKRKGRKSGLNKKMPDNGNRFENEQKNGGLKDTDEFEGTEINNGYFPPNFSDENETSRDRRKIGKLIVTNKLIAKGSNGTIVLEGNYDGRSVAVKRLVRTHHDVAVKEIQNLIASDQHPNIVRWYGMEYDQDFVYLSLERCSCCLHEFVLSYTLQNQIATGDENFESFGAKTSDTVLIWTVGNKEFDLWNAKGYPSTILLKLMKDVVCGLAHLHELGIIHRDLKPQNVLVCKDRVISAKISDMGISKQLDGELSSLTKHATGYGSSGWQAPEQLRRERQTRAVDLFSLGCILFFCITGGKHPFGENLERDVNIVNNRKDLFLIDHIPEAIDLISRLLEPSPDARPKAVEVLRHPMFWNSETRLSFLRDVSDRVELEDRENESELLEALESRGRVALGGKWDEKMDNTFLNDIGRYRRYKFDSVRDLLRVIRNKLNHYRELSKEIQLLLGSVPEGFDSYFSTRFPKLLIEVYGVIHSHCVDEEAFHKYFSDNTVRHTFV